ncbi:unnamed protein product [Leptosia nina]|uniref:Uncharacterized protein n=1 Tax=Leptosia nina TaxID=320188 RepID=A0AAV1IV04_9NEOP
MCRGNETIEESISQRYVTQHNISQSSDPRLFDIRCAQHGPAMPPAAPPAYIKLQYNRVGTKNKVIND